MKKRVLAVLLLPRADGEYSDQTYSVQSLYNISRFNMDLDKTLSCCGSNILYH